MSCNEPMMLAIKQARKTMNQDIGGCFGAAITDKDGNIIAVNSNRVLGNNDPTAHAEITAIRSACRKLGTHDLSGYTMYATGHPCPMCLSAIIWANIKQCYFGCRPEDADKIGFRDDFIYGYIEAGCTDERVLKLEETDREQCLALFEEYSEKQKRIY